MPMIVVGADTQLGAAIVEEAIGRAGEVRAFVTDAEAGARLRDRSVKVATGDVSDPSHVGGAALGCFSAVLVAAAAADGRPMAFASDPERVVGSWVDAVVESGVTRVVLVGEGASQSRPLALGSAPEWAVVEAAGRTPERVAGEVLRLDDAAEI